MLGNVKAMHVNCNLKVSRIVVIRGTKIDQGAHGGAALLSGLVLAPLADLGLEATLDGIDGSPTTA